MYQYKYGEHYIIVLFVVIYMSICIGKALSLNVSTVDPLGGWRPPEVWARQDIPDPQVDIWKCGRGGKRSYVCNPNNVLTDQQGV